MSGAARGCEAAAGAGLVLLALLLPFELQEPLFAWGPIGVTDVELALYAVLAAWGLGRILGERASWSAVHAAVLCWAVAVALSALFATGDRTSGVKFALRSLGGCALFFASADVTSGAVWRARVLRGLAAGVAVSAAASVLESAWPSFGAELLRFKASVPGPDSIPRISGTFQYPNIASMYAEASLPVVLAATSAPLAAVVGVLAAAAIVASASRAGLLVGAFTLGLVATADRSGRLALRTGACAGLAALVVLTALQPSVVQRFRSGDSAWYQAEYRPAVGHVDVRAGESVALEVTARNLGSLAWWSAGAFPIVIGHAWRDAEGRDVAEGAAAPLPRDVKPGESVVVSTSARAPAAVGRYTLRWRLEGKGVAWRDPPGVASSGDVTVEVFAGPALMAPAPRPALPLQGQPTRVELWRAGLGMWRARPLVGVGPDGFRRRYSRYLGAYRLDDRVRANSLYVETLADLGLVGFASLLGIIATLARVAVRRLSKPARLQERALALALSAGLLAFFLHGVVDDFFPFTSTYGLFWLLAGALAAEPQ